VIDPLRLRARADVLELLERRHGFGVRAAGCPSWVHARLDRALDALAPEGGGTLDGAVELLRRDPGRLAELADLLRVGETRFYRDPPQWQALADHVLPALSERVRAVSIGCSTGEEAWTLGMLLDRARGKGGYRVVGMDRSDVAVESASVGAYPKQDARHLPSELAERYLEFGQDAVRVVGALRASVSFTVRDAMIGPPPGHWEIVLCKNVLIYFGDEAAERAVQLMLRGLADGGVLMVAKSEVPRVRALGHRAEELAPGVIVFRG
jgi:chemotaxis protein methyltransferase CheR